MAEGDWTGDGFWKSETKGAAEATSAVVAEFLAKAFELKRSALLWSKTEDTVFHLWNDLDGVQINACEFRMSLNEAAQFFAEHGSHERFRRSHPFVGVSFSAALFWMPLCEEWRSAYPFLRGA